MGPRKFIVLVTLLAAAAIVGASAWAAALLHARRTLAPAEQAAAIGGPFELIDHNGVRVTDRDLRGRPTVMFFGFTSCPDVCPTTLIQIGQWLEALGSDADRLNVVFISVDPERDTPARLKAYLSAFDPRIRGLTGTPAQVAVAAKAFRIYYQKRPVEGSDYSVDHSSVTYLLDERGRFVEPIAYGTPPDRAVTQLRQVLAE